MGFDYFNNANLSLSRDVAELNDRGDRHVLSSTEEKVSVSAKKSLLPEMVKVSSFELDKMHFSSLDPKTNNWKASFFLEDGTKFTFQAPDHASAGLFPTELVFTGANLSILKERRTLEGKQDSWFTFKNLATGKEFKAIGASRLSLPDLQGENVFYVENSLFEKKEEGSVIKFHLRRGAEDIFFTLETKDDVQQDYFDRLPLVLLEELEREPGKDGGYRRQFKFYHPLLEKEVRLVGDWEGLPRQFTLTRVDRRIASVKNDNAPKNWDADFYFKWEGKEIQLRGSGGFDYSEQRAGRRGKFGTGLQASHTEIGRQNDRMEIIDIEGVKDPKKQTANYRIKNLNTGTIRTYEGPLMSIEPKWEILDLEGEDIHHMKRVRVDLVDEEYRVQFDLEGSLGVHSIEFVTKENPKYYMDGMPLVFVKELDDVAEENYHYRKQFAFYHPMLKEEIVFKTIIQGGPLAIAPKQEGDHVHYVSNLQISEKDGIYKMRFDLKGRSAAYSMESETTVKPEGYENGMPLLFIKELETLEGENGFYRKKFALFHPVKKEEVIFSTERLGGGVSRTILSTSVSNIKGNVEAIPMKQPLFYAQSWDARIELEGELVLFYKGTYQKDGKIPMILTQEVKRSAPRIAQAVFPQGALLEIIKETIESSDLAIYQAKDQNTGKLYEFTGKPIHLFRS